MPVSTRREDEREDAEEEQQPLRGLRPRPPAMPMANALAFEPPAGLDRHRGVVLA
jgi:hypothetical protein